MKPYSFQQEAIDKLTKPKITSRAIGDDMGLGKTAEAIWIDLKKRTALAKLDREKFGKIKNRKTLIIAPLAVLEAWERHLRQLAPDARVVICNNKNRADFVKALRQPFHYYLIHWEGMRIEVKALSKVHWFHIIADEVHRAKNRKAQVTHALKSLSADEKTALSGTLADDKPMDLWSILNWLWPAYYRSYWKFVKHYAVFESEMNWGTGQTFQKFAGVQNAESLHKEMEPWFIRRLKEEVLEDLPEKYYSDVWVDLHPKQRRAYEEMKEDMITWIEDNKDQPLPIMASVVVAQLTRLQQFALGWMKGEVGWTKEKMVQVKGLDGQVLVDENGKPRMRKQPPEQFVTYTMMDPSAKLDALMSILDDNPDKQVVVFSQFKGVLHLLSNRLREAKIPHGLYTGDVPKGQRDKLIQDFQAGKVRVFAGTIAAGGEGITLTAADTVVFLDRSWKPSKNRQAEDRLHRIGQKNAVHIIDIMAKDTVDLGRRQRIEQKWAWIQEILGDSAKVQREAQSWTIPTR